VITSEVVKLTGLTFRQMNTWTKADYIRPVGGGKGNEREWPTSEVNIIKVTLQLMNAGFTLSAAAPYARTLIETGEHFIELGSKCLLMIEPNI
jgi:DNA-binding transcriptional MerR regulator